MSAAGQQLFLLHLVCAVLCTTVSSHDHEIEVHILMDFKMRIHEDPKKVLFNWNPEVSEPCLWSGIKCDSNARVTVISLPDKELVGSVSEMLRGLQFLRKIDLSGNFFKGGFPTSLLDGLKIRSIDLSTNEFSGILPEDMRMPKLISLDLKHNNFNGPLPKYFPEGLRRLDLSANKFSGKVPQQIGNLTQLKVLKVSNNKLTGNIQSSIFNCKLLRVVEFSNNFFTGPIPSEFGNLKMLRSLNLSNNHLKGSVPEELGNLTELKILDLSSNELQGGVTLSKPSSSTSVSDLNDQPTRRIHRFRFEHTIIAVVVPLCCFAIVFTFIYLWSKSRRVDLDSLHEEDIWVMDFEVVWFISRFLRIIHEYKYGSH